MSDEEKVIKDEKGIPKFGFGPDREPVPADKLINTSGLNLAKQEIFEMEGKQVRSGYLSYSAMGDYKRCQKYFEFKYIKKEKGKVSIAMVEGGSVHKVVEAILLPTMKKEKPISAEIACQTFRDVLEEKIENLKDTLIWEGEEKGRLIDANIGLIKKFHKEIAPKLNPVSIEEMFITHVPISGTNGTIPVIGFIDLIDMTFNKGQVILDVKTGRTLKTEDDLITDAQLTLYSMAKNIANVGFLSMKKGTADKPGGVSAKTNKPLKGKPGVPPQIARVEGTKSIKDYKYLVEDISATAKGISAGYFDRNGRGSWLCSKKYCPFFDKCLG